MKLRRPSINVGKGRAGGSMYAAERMEDCLTLTTAPGLKHAREMRQWYPRDKQKGQEDREESSEMVTLIEEGGTLAKIVAACSGPSLIVKGHKRHRN